MSTGGQISADLPKAPTLGDFLRLDDGEGTPEYRAWVRRQKRRHKVGAK